MVCFILPLRLECDGHDLHPSDGYGFNGSGSCVDEGQLPRHLEAAAAVPGARQYTFQQACPGSPSCPLGLTALWWGSRHHERLLALPLAAVLGLVRLWSWLASDKRTWSMKPDGEGLTPGFKCLGVSTGSTS